MLKSFAVLAFAFFLVACEQPSSDNGGGGSNGPNANLLGLWRGACEVLEPSASASSNIEFGGSDSLTLNVVVTSFTDNSCGTQGLIQRYGGPAVINGQDMDVANARIYFKPVHTWIVDALNTSNYCGFSDWQINVEKEVTGVSCGGTTMPSSFYSIVKIEGGKLYIGKPDSGHDATTPGTRPTEFDPTPYSR